MVELKNVCAGFHNRPVLKNVCADIKSGEITVLLGPNGCGKSTLLKAVVGICSLTEGQILVNGTDARTLSPMQLARRVAYLPQNRTTPDISVLRMVLHGRFPYLSYPRRYRAEDFKIAKNALEWVGLSGLEDESIDKLSGGMQQKVYIATALAQDADVILMDEPTTYLDIAHQLRLMELAQQLASNGKAVVMVLHDLSQALRIADQIIVMRDGKVEMTGNPEDVFYSRVLDRCFDVKLCRHQTNEGWQYFCC